MMPRGKKQVLTQEERLAQALVPEVEWPYGVPGNWVWVRFRVVLEYEQPTAYIVESTEYKDEYLTPVLTAGKSFILGYTNEDFGVCDDLPVVIFDDFTTATQYVDFPFKVKSSAMKILRPITEVGLKFIFYYMQTVNCDSSNHKRFWISTYSGLPFPLPPLPEQHRIVARIESLFSKLDRAKELAQAALDSFETRKASILHKAFSGELTAGWREANGIGLDSWENSKLGTIANIKSSKRIFAEEYQEDGIPFFRSSEVVELNDFGYTEPKYFISNERYEQIKSHFGVPSAGDLLVTSVGTIGKTWIADGREFYYKDGNLTQVEQCEPLEMRYLQYFISSGEFKAMISDTVAGSAYNALTIVKFKNIAIPLPTLPEQQQIIHILDNLLAKEKAARELADAIEKIDHMKKAILARAFRGELGTNDPSEESAIGLLKEHLM